MTCPHGVSTARSEAWWRREEDRVKAQGSRPFVSACACCGGPFPRYHDDDPERCAHCLRRAA